MELVFIPQIADNIIQGVAIQYQIISLFAKSKIYLNQQKYIKLSSHWVLLKAIIQ